MSETEVVELSPRVSDALAAENAHWPNGRINDAARRVAVKRRARQAIGWVQGQTSSQPQQLQLGGAA